MGELVYIIYSIGEKDNISTRLDLDCVELVVDNSDILDWLNGKVGSIKDLV